MDKYYMIEGLSYRFYTLRAVKIFIAHHYTKEQIFNELNGRRIIKYVCDIPEREIEIRATLDTYSYSKSKIIK